MVAERIPSEGSERARGLGSEVGERLGGSERGELGGAETLRAWRARGELGGGVETLSRAWRACGVQGEALYSVQYACAVRSAWARPPRASVECSERSSTRVWQSSEE